MAIDWGDEEQKFIAGVFAICEEVKGRYHLHPAPRTLAGIRALFDAVYHAGLQIGLYPEEGAGLLGPGELKMLLMRGRCNECEHLVALHTDALCRMPGCTCDPG